ncbi:MAG TPA: ABC transporter substrate-binding protein [Acidimicrobiales bacterium]|nr:ABC transporter substrate-binding protein [Acidimicrobiales bacterium]
MGDHRGEGNGPGSGAAGAAGRRGGAFRRRRLGLASAAVVIGGAAVAALGTAAAASAASRAEQSGGPVLTWGQYADPGSLWNATDFNATDGAPIMSLVNQGLLAFTPNNQLAPALATSWKEVTPTDYVYTIRTGVKFSNGDPLTPQDVVYSFDVQRNPQVASDESTFFTDITSVTASGDDVIVKLAQPDAIWTDIPAHEGGYIYDEKSLEGHLKDYGTPSVLPIGTGPYEVQSYIANSSITLVRNPYYWGPKPYYSEIVFDIIPNDQTLFLAVESGKVQGTFDVPSSSLRQWTATPTIHVIKYPADGFFGWTLDETEAPFNDIHVRKAIAYATNRAGIASAVFGGTAVVAKTLDDPRTFQGILPASEVAKAFAAIPAYSYDTAAAKAQMAESTVPHGFTTTLNVAADCQPCSEISEAEQQTLGQIGITLKLKTMPGPARFQLILKHGKDLGIQLIGNLADVPNPIELPWLYYASDQAVRGGNNSSNFSNPEVDKLINEGIVSSTDMTSVAEDALQAETIAADNVAMVPIVYLDDLAATSGSLTMSSPGAFFDDYLWIDQLHR